jgi:hypothetical protein
MKYNTVSTALNAARLITLVLAVYTQFALAFPLGAAAPHLPPLKTGDIVFQNSSSSAREAIMIASGSPYTHVGIIEIDAKKRPFVIEAVGPVRSVPLDTWRRNGIEQRITVMRVKGLTEVDAMQAIARARQYTGRPYDHHYFETRDRIYCSELVHAAFKEGLGIILGREQRLRDLNTDTAAAHDLIKKHWRTHPLCAGKLADFGNCRDLILDQTVVTPASIAVDEQLELVYTDFDVKVH